MPGLLLYDYYDFLGPWAAYFRNNGGFAALKDNIGDYNVPYLYFLAALSYFNVPDFYLIKLFSVLFDVALSWGRLPAVPPVLPDDSPRPAAAFCLLLLLPTVVLNGACWSQCDSIYAALILHALACGLERQSAPSLVLAGLAFSVKLQTIFLLPLWAPSGSPAGSGPETCPSSPPPFWPPPSPPCWRESPL